MTDHYAKDFSNNLDLSLKYLDRISKKLDSVSKREFYSSITVGSVEEEAKGGKAFSAYMNDVKDLYENKMGKFELEKEQGILRSLSFGQLYDRESAIPPAHQRTFEWMLSNTDGGFVQWLKEQNCTFWVSGKAGSGKSTLMRYLTEHSTTHQMLTEWAGGGLVVAKHFFWRPGTPLQKSQEGLFRSLLLQVLMKRPGLIPIVCSERWLGPYSDSFLPWSRSQLVEAMRHLRSALEDTSLPKESGFQLCIFVDGLDEFDGDHFELVKILSNFTKPSRVKMCASSRLWLEFVDAFGSGPWKIQVENLTRRDMLIYVHDHLEAHDKFSTLRAKDAKSASDLITNVVKRAEGVFLWVYLVVRSLLRGLRNEDSLRDLMRRMETLPPDLGTYFERMLNEIEDVYRQRTARLFLSLSIARTSMPVITFFFLDLDDGSNEVEPGIISSLREWPRVDTIHLEALSVKKRQLIAQCKDIIHVTPDKDAPLLFGEKVGFLHRTVFDFINTEETYRYLLKLAGPSFVPRKPLFRANLGQVKAMIHLHPRTYIKPHLHNWILGAVFYAYEMEVASAASTHPSNNEINVGLDELDQIMTEQFATWNFQHAAKTLLKREDFISFFNLVAVCDLSSYVRYKQPNVTPNDLDVLAPGWRAPNRVEQLGAFEIVPQTSDGYWRLGNELGIPFGSKMGNEAGGCSAEEMVGQGIDKDLRSEDGLSDANFQAMIHESVGAENGAKGGYIHRRIKKLSIMWHRRPKTSAFPHRGVSGD